MKKKFCYIRKDLEEQKLSVPVELKHNGMTTDFYIHGKRKFEYRITERSGEEDIFEVKVNGYWVRAYSIDFEFDNTPGI